MRSLPQAVFEHYRQPRNEGELDPADAIGEVDGRREGSRLRLFLRLEGGRVSAARFTVRGDRSSAAGLSLLTTWLEGRPLEEVEAASAEGLAQAWGLVPEQRPMLVLPLEALEDALCAWRGQASPFQDEGPLVCHCLSVRRGRILRAIERRGLRELGEVQFWTRACTGCRTCRSEVEGLLRKRR